MEQKKLPLIFSLKKQNQFQNNVDLDVTASFGNKNLNKTNQMQKSIKLNQELKKQSQQQIQFKKFFNEMQNIVFENKNIITNKRVLPNLPFKIKTNNQQQQRAKSGQNLEFKLNQQFNTDQKKDQFRQTRVFSGVQINRQQEDVNVNTFRIKSKRSNSAGTQLLKKQQNILKKLYK